jgi:hypothetical protein
MFTPNTYLRGETVLTDPTVESAACGYAADFTYASDAVDDPPTVTAYGALVYFSTRIKSTVSRSTNTSYPAAIIPVGFRPITTLPRLHFSTYAVSSSNAVGPVFRCEVEPDLNDGIIEINCPTGQTPTWSTSTYIYLWGFYLRAMT